MGISNTPADSTANSAVNSAYHTQWTPSTAQSILRTRGPQIRRSGAAESTTAAALSQSFQSFQFRSLPRHQPILTIAPMGSQIGKQDGPLQRRLGAAVMKARASHQQLVC